MKKIFTFAIALVCAMAANAAEPAKGNLVLSGSASELAPVVVTAGAESTAYLWIDIKETQKFCGIEADMTLPAGLEITKAVGSTLTKDEDGETTHSISKPTLKGDAWKLLIYSADMNAFPKNQGSVAKLTIKVAAGFVGGEAVCKNILFSCTDQSAFDSAKGVDGESFVIAETTGINDVNAKGIDVNAPMYNMQGVQVKSATKGVFIQNGKKYIVK